MNNKIMVTERIKNFKIYLDERFPARKNSFFVLMFTLSAYVYTGFLYNMKILGMTGNDPDRIPMPLHKVIPLFIIILMFFFQLRLTDEFKDYEEDLKYRPYRPVQRGIITLKTLRNIGIVTVIMQIISAFLINPKILIYMSFVWIYMFLMAKEFFIKEWLTKRIVIYALSHVVIMIFINLVIIKAAGFIMTSHEMTDLSVFEIYRGIIPFLMLGYLNGMVLEIGRKTRKSDEEEHGVETYSKLWGRKKVVYILCGLYILDYILVMLGLLQTNEKYFLLGMTVLTIVLAVSVYFMIKFLKKIYREKFPKMCRDSGFCFHV
ncbi:UbiA family prenyltransferase [Pseudoleptotrichia goodfellowii]|uniref:UbiA family prenyltransferase n=1 Tax=Pseudoleptotrichia goodfellowii TaxID=157692 RepID=UPI0004AF76D4|nr:UbiA family prenyltransferase [Pseudoleptotrichia goodfellowii]